MTRLRTQAGIGAITVIVLIVLFALLGTYMLSMSTVSSLNTTQSGSAMQSWFAARAGAEWAVQKALAASCSCTGINGETIDFTEGGLNGYSADVNCSTTAVTEAGVNYCVYNLSVTSTNNSSAQLTRTASTLSLRITDRNAP